MHSIIPFETSKLLKEKGYNNPCFYFYNKTGKLLDPYLENGSSTDVEFRVDLTDLLENYNNRYKSDYSAPTIAEVVYWTFKIHGVWISVKGDDNKTFKYELHRWSWYEHEKTLRLGHVMLGTGIFDIDSEPFNTPIEAYQEAISYVLKNLI